MLQHDLLMFLVQLWNIYQLSYLGWYLILTSVIYHLLFNLIFNFICPVYVNGIFKRMT